MSVQPLEIIAPSQVGGGTSLVLTPMDMLNRALEQNASMEVLERLMTMQERWEATQARKAYHAAMAAAKAEIPVISKNCSVDFTSQKGRTNYRYEDLAEIARTVDPILSKHGIFYHFITHSIPGEPISVTCVLTHRDGHCVQNTLTAGRDESGNKNGIQSIGSAVTYLQRYTLKAALGLAAAKDDDGALAPPVPNGDGNGASGNGQRAPDAANKTITAEQAVTITQLVGEVKADIPKFLTYMRVPSIAEMPANQYQRAIDALNAKRRRSA